MNTSKYTHKPWLSMIAFAVALGLLSVGFATFSSIRAAGLAGSAQTPGGNADQAPAIDSLAGQGALKVIASDAQGIVIELLAGEPVVEDVTLQGERFQQFTLPDSELTATPGAPQLPMRSTLLGAPTTEGLTFEILAAEQETRTGLRLAPAPRSVVQNAHNDMTGGELAEVFALDEQRYQTDAFSPGSLVQLGDPGYMRDQAMFRVTFYPVQYNPVRREVQFYRRLRVRIHWAAPVQAATNAPRGSSAAYEGLLAKTLFNYNTLDRVIAPKMPPLAAAQTSSQSVVSAAASAEQPQLKLGIDHEGLYAITYDQLVQAGFGVATLDPHTFAMTNLGHPVAIAVIGEEDGHFDPGDQILFYGIGCQHDLYTTINVYWLTGGGSPGQRMGSGAAPGGTLPTPTHFRTTVHAERDTVYWQNMLTDNAKEDRWFWERRLSLATTGFPAARTFTVTLPSLDPVAESSPTLRVKLKGYTNVGHLTRLLVNGHDVGAPFAWTGQVEYTQTVDIEPGWLKAGDNLVTVEVRPNGAPPGSSAPDEILVNWIEIAYWRTYTASGDVIHFTTPLPGDQGFVLSGFSDPNVTVLDVTDAYAPLRMATTVDQQAHTLFQASPTAASHYFAASKAGYQQPVYLLKDEPSALRATPPGTDYIIITYPDFYASAARLAQYRQDTSQLQTQIVKIDDIYDEFNFGVANPQAIRTYLTYVYTSTGSAAPDYVLLLGDATLDYRGNFPGKMPNYVPTQVMTSTLFGEVPSDNWFVTLAGNDPIPEMFIGRLGAQSVAEANRMVDKIINYHPDPSWNNTTLFVADDDETKFRTNSDELIRNLPFGYITKTVYVTNTQPLGVYRKQVIDAINQGAVLVNYFGHGEYFGWGLTPNVGVPAEYIFHTSDVAKLTNRNRLPVVTIANCLNGAFAGAGDQPSLAEVLQSAPNGGAVAVWAPASIGHPTGHRELIGNFYKAIFAHDHFELGKAAATAKADAYERSTRWAELVQTYVLLGDPAMRVGVATTDPYVASVSLPNGATGVDINRPIEVRFNKPMSATTVSLTSSAPITFALIEVRDNQLFIFDHTPFAYFTSYTVQVQGQDVVDNSNLRAGPVLNPWSFTTAQDVPPTASIALRPGMPNRAARADSLQINFSEPVRPTITYRITPAVTGRLRLSNDGLHAVFDHENFQLGQTYNFTLLSAEDATGNRLTSSVSFTFTVGNLLFLPYTPK